MLRVEICLSLNIHWVSAYAFSIENFKRSPEEVKALTREITGVLWPRVSFISILCVTLRLTSFRDLLDEYGFRLSVVGRMSPLPIQDKIDLHRLGVPKERHMIRVTKLLLEINHRHNTHSKVSHVCYSMQGKLPVQNGVIPTYWRAVPLRHVSLHELQEVHRVSIRVTHTKYV